MPLPTRWKWKLQRLQNDLEVFKERMRELFHEAKAKQKMCPNCRALLSASEKRCPFCDTRIGAFDSVGVRRVTSSILPDVNFTFLLFSINLLVFIVSLIAASKTGTSMEGLISGVPNEMLIFLGSNYGPLVAAGEYWRLLSGTFLHANLLHLGFNMLVLFQVGPMVEELYGSSRFMVAYMFAALTGSLTTYWIHHGNMVGASGAIFGLLGLMFVYGYRNRGGMGDQIRGMFGRWIVFGLFFGMMPGTDNVAHFGGLLGGALFGLLVDASPPMARQNDWFWRVLSYLCWLAIAGTLVIMGFSFARLGLIGNGQ